MSREKTASAPNSFVLAGNLADELTNHAQERCRYFFTFVFAARVIADYLKLDASSIMLHKATHQIDTGFRSTNPVYTDFDVKDPKVVQRSCSSFKRTDAAHFCNLGIDAKAQTKIATAANTDERIHHFYTMLLAFSGATRRLPQRVNIGPDRIVDEYHAYYATTLLKGSAPVLSRGTLGQYLQDAATRLKGYRAMQSAEKNAGLVACVDAYLRCYAERGDVLWSHLWMSTDAECRVRSYGLDPKRYVSML